MRMPGFTAEVALREATACYRPQVAYSYSGTVVPAMLCRVCGFNIYGQYECWWETCFQPPRWPV